MILDKGMLSLYFNAFLFIHLACLMSLACNNIQRREVFENLTINNVIYDEDTNCYKVKIDFHEKSQRESKVDLIFPEAMTEFITFWIEICMTLILNLMKLTLLIVLDKGNLIQKRMKE
jgi:hypothetical protein